MKVSPLKYIQLASKLIASLGSSIDQLDSCGDVGRAVEDENILLKEFNKEVGEPTPMFTGTIRKMLEERDCYSAIAISNNALTTDDFKLLINVGKLTKEERAALPYDSPLDRLSNMMMERDTGFFIKLYEEREYVESMFGALAPDYHNVKKLCLSAHDAGYRMVEFDSGAALYNKGYDDGE